MATKRRKAPKPGVELRKACRCRGSSSGRYRHEGRDIPVAFGLIFGLVPRMTCDKCGKAWKRKES